MNVEFQFPEGRIAVVDVQTPLPPVYRLPVMPEPMTHFRAGVPSPPSDAIETVEFVLCRSVLSGYPAYVEAGLAQRRDARAAR